MLYIVYDKLSGEIVESGSRPEVDPYVLPADKNDLGVLTGQEGCSSSCYVDVQSGVIKKIPPKPDGVARFNYTTKQWDVDALASIRHNRAVEYPSIGDQLDALWKGGDALIEMQARIMAVKEKYPKE
jgi:hypothetical protein